MTKQMEMELTDKRTTHKSRPHHRTTTITVDKKTFNAYMLMPEGSSMKCVFANDIVSTSKGGESAVHHFERRSAILRKQLLGGFLRLKMRTDGEIALNCEMYQMGKEPDDESAVTVYVRKPIALVA